MSAVDTNPCTCIPGVQGVRPPILDPFCPRDEAHRELAVLHYEPKYPSKNGYDPMFIHTEKETA